MRASSASSSVLSPPSLCRIAVLTVLIVLTGSVKIPGPVPGTDFQLSAPLAVAICAAFGFKRYFIAGCLASLLSLLLGTQTVLHVAIALQFRLWVGMLLAVGRPPIISIILAGPLASILARLSLYPLFGDAVLTMVLAAVPGYVFTACAAPFFTALLRRIDRVSASRAARYVTTK